MKPRFIAAIMALLLGLCSGQAAHADSFPSGSIDSSYPVNSGSTRVIDLYGTCRVVTNNTSKAVYVPIQSLPAGNEWNGPNGFAYKAAPPGITMTQCYRCTVNWPQTTYWSTTTVTPGVCTQYYNYFDSGWYAGTYPWNGYPYCGYWDACYPAYVSCTPDTTTTNNYSYTNYSPVFYPPVAYDNLTVTMVSTGGGGGGTYNWNVIWLSSSGFLGLGGMFSGGCTAYLPYAGDSGNVGAASYFATSSVATYAAGGGGGCGAGACSGLASSPASYGPSGWEGSCGTVGNPACGPVNPLSTSVNATGLSGASGYGGFVPEGCGPYYIYGQGNNGASGSTVVHTYNSDDYDLNPQNAFAGPSPPFGPNSSINVTIGQSGVNGAGAGGTGGNGMGDGGSASGNGTGQAVYSTNALDTINPGASCAQEGW